MFIQKLALLITQPPFFPEDSSFLKHFSYVTIVTERKIARDEK